MKLRIRGDSIRVRLTQKEVSHVAEGKLVEESLNFGGGVRLRYSVEPSSAAAVAASFVDGRVIVALPTTQALAWARGNEVAIQSAPGTVPSILVEKDFACLKPRTNEKEDETDMFPNPNLAHGHCT
jgi:hypothetical protein